MVTVDRGLEAVPAIFVYRWIWVRNPDAKDVVNKSLPADLAKNPSRTNARSPNYILETPPKLYLLRGDQKLPPNNKQSALLVDFHERFLVPQ